MEIPVLETERLILRKVKATDIHDIYHYASDDEVTKYVCWPKHLNIKMTEQFLDFLGSQYKTGNYYYWALIHKADNKMIGTAGLPKINDSIGEIGFVIAKEYWNQGLASEVVKEVIKFGFAKLGLKKIIGYCYKKNIASGKVMTKCGMTFTQVVNMKCGQVAKQKLSNQRKPIEAKEFVILNSLY